MTIEAKWHYGHFIDPTMNVHCLLFQKHIKAFFVLVWSLFEPEIRYEQICLAWYSTKKKRKYTQVRTTTKNWLFDVYPHEID